MPKRKRDDQEILTSSNPHKSHGAHSSHRVRGAEEKIHHGKKLLHRALKVAKGFERQKLGRRRKTAVQKKDDEGAVRIDAEIQALKTLDLNVVAETQFYKTLLKEKAISSSPFLPAHVRADGKPAQDAATANVTARLYNSNPVKEALAGTMPSVRAILGVNPQSMPANSKSESGKKAASDLTDQGETMQMDDSDDSVDEEDQADEDEDMSGVGGDRPIPANAGHTRSFADDVSEDDENFDALDARIGSDSDDSDAMSDLDIETSKTPVDSASARHPAIDLSLSPSPFPSASPPPITKSKKSTKEPKLPSSATFLPSLTMGGYWSGSESGSEPEQDIDEFAPRKNRRGQRARQLIWEKKFGKGAKHIQNGTGAKQTRGRSARDQGWDLKRGAQAEGDGRRNKGYQPRWMQGKGSRGLNEDAASGGNTTKLGKRPTKTGSRDAKALHPSWEAAKKAKEQRQTGAFEGKKVVFD